MARPVYNDMAKKRSSKPRPITAYVSYSEKLRDPRWQKMRLEIMQRDKFSCRICNNTEQTLNVHHRYYVKGAAPWDYDHSALVTLCKDCHAAAESERDFIQQACAGPSYQQTFIAQVLSAQSANEINACPHLMHAMDALAGLLRDVNECRADPSEAGSNMDMIHSSYRQVVVHLGNAVGVIERMYYGVDEA